MSTTVSEASPATSPVDLGLPVFASLSPSRAGDFMTCPLLFRFRTIDRLPQQPSPAATRGTVVHEVLERLFDLPSGGRTLAAAQALVGPVWEQLCEAEPEVTAMFDGDEDLATWLSSAGDLLSSYFEMEDPNRLEPSRREEHVQVDLPGGLRLRGIVDRVDVSATGLVRVVDYKTGRSPGEHFEGKALFQMKFYALVIWRTTGVVPTVLQLMYLADQVFLRYEPDESDLIATERKLLALWEAIERATQLRSFRPNPSRLCSWCDHHDLCPEFGGTPPPWPEGVAGPTAPEVDRAELP